MIGMKRILVIGSGGAGKSRLALQLAQLTGLPLLHLDALYWRPGWVEPTKDEWNTTIDRLLAGDSWIMDGNFGGTLERRIEACDTVIFLDVSRWVCLWRVIARRIRHHGRARPDMTPGCPEKLDWPFLGWILSYPEQRGRWVASRLKKLRPDQQALVFKTTRDIEHFLQSVSATQRA